MIPQECFRSDTPTTNFPAVTPKRIPSCVPSGNLAALTGVRLPLAAYVYPAPTKRSEGLETALLWALGDDLLRSGAGFRSHRTSGLSSYDTWNALPWLVRKADMPTHHFDRSLLEAAVIGFEQQKQQIDARIAELRAMLSGGPAESSATSEPPKRKRRKMSAAGRKAIAEAQRKRWAASKKAAEPSAPAKAEPAKPKRRISKAGMARIIAATKRRWRLQKAAAKAAAKKAAPARKKVAGKKATVKAPPAKMAKKAAPKKVTTAAAQAVVQGAN